MRETDTGKVAEVEVGASKHFEEDVDVSLFGQFDLVLLVLEQLFEAHGNWEEHSLVLGHLLEGLVNMD